MTFLLPPPAPSAPESFSCGACSCPGAPSHGTFPSGKAAQDMNLNADLAAHHRRKCATLAAEFEQARARGERIGLRKSTSNLFRQRASAGKRFVDVGGFDRVLAIDPQRMTADVEGMI